MEQKYITINETERLQNLPYETYGEYHLTQQNTDWVQSLLSELCDYDSEDKQLATKPVCLNIDLRLKRDINNRYKDYLLLHATIHAQYYTKCSRCLMPAFQEINFEFHIGFLNQKLEELDELYEQDVVILEHEEYDLYFYAKHNIPFKECIREQIIMHLPAYPLHDENCKGLCTTCGQNLNIQTCKHNH